MIVTYQRTDGSILNIEQPEQGEHHCQLPGRTTCMNRPDHEQCLGSYAHMCIVCALKSKMIKRVDIDKPEYNGCEGLFLAIF